MQSKKPKKPMYTAPVGEAVFPWLNKPDARSFNGETPKPAWKLNIKYNATSPAWTAFKEKIDAFVDEALVEGIKAKPKKKNNMEKEYPYFMETDDEGDETGNVIFKMKQNAFITPKDGSAPIPVSVDLYMPDLSPLNRETTPIFGGSTVVAKFQVRPYCMDKNATSAKVGVSIDLKAVQVVSLRTVGQRSGESYGFERYENEDEGEVTENNETAQDDASDPTDF